MIWKGLWWRWAFSSCFAFKGDFSMVLDNKSYWESDEDCMLFCNTNAHVNVKKKKKSGDFVHGSQAKIIRELH